MSYFSVNVSLMCFKTKGSIRALPFKVIEAHSRATRLRTKESIASSSMRKTFVSIFASSKSTFFSVLDKMSIALSVSFLELFLWKNSSMESHAFFNKQYTKAVPTPVVIAFGQVFSGLPSSEYIAGDKIQNTIARKFKTLLLSARNSVTGMKNALIKSFKTDSLLVRYVGGRGVQASSAFNYIKYWELLLP